MNLDKNIYLLVRINIKKLEHTCGVPALSLHSAICGIDLNVAVAVVEVAVMVVEMDIYAYIN